MFIQFGLIFTEIIAFLTINASLSICIIMYAPQVSVNKECISLKFINVVVIIRVSFS